MRTPWEGLLPALALAALSSGCDRARPLQPSAGGGCTACHGGPANAAPPNAVSGGSATTTVSVGAHQLHLRDTPIRGALACSECHAVPHGILSPGHLDGSGTIVTWGPLASARNAAPSWDHVSATCSGVYCHGARMRAPPQAAPVWTYAAEPVLAPPSPAVCGACHGYPPPMPHPQQPACHACHPDTVADDGTIDVAGGHHVDGRLDVRGDFGCTACHGDERRPASALEPALPAAPPLGAAGETRTSERAVGAHQAHLQDGPLRRALRCAECHLVPTDLTHVDGVVELVWGSLATHAGASPAWDGASCASTYCHGRFRNGNTANAPVWTGGPAQAACGTCHGLPPIAPHPQAGTTACGGCHPGYTRESVDPELHVNGAIDLGGSGAACASCHGFPPATGAHVAHVGAVRDPSAARYGEALVLEDLFPAATPSSAPATYFFGCGQCHPVDASSHMDGSIEVDLQPVGAPAGSLKARNAPAAAYDVASGRCSGVYCHSSGQLTPEWQRTRGGAAIDSPPWTSGQHLACDGCHDDPPAYASGGAGSTNANSHLVLADDGYESGHFGGFPSAWHGSNHGVGNGGAASAVTCQTCHAETVDPASTGPSGFYWLDTTGNYDLGGQLRYACASCHAQGVVQSPAAQGRVLPLRHVNGRRDVVFDARTALPAYSALPAAPDTPSRPIWESPGSLAAVDLAPDMTYDGATLSAHLGSARYDPATKTCGSVACHLAQTSVTWGGPEGFGQCRLCHAF